MAVAALKGFRVGVTADRRAAEQIQLLQRRGATTLHGPAIQTLHLGPDAGIHRATAAMLADPPEVLIANTGIGVRAWLGVVESWGWLERLLDSLAATRVLARGPKAAG